MVDPIPFLVSLSGVLKLDGFRAEHSAALVGGLATQRQDQHGVPSGSLKPYPPYNILGSDAGGVNPGNTLWGRPRAPFL